MCLPCLCVVNESTLPLTDTHALFRSLSWQGVYKRYDSTSDEMKTQNLDATSKFVGTFSRKHACSLSKLSLGAFNSARPIFFHALTDGGSSIRHLHICSADAETLSVIHVFESLQTLDIDFYVSTDDDPYEIGLCFKALLSNNPLQHITMGQDVLNKVWYPSHPLPSLQTITISSLEFTFSKFDFEQDFKYGLNGLISLLKYIVSGRLPSIKEIHIRSVEICGERMSYFKGQDFEQEAQILDDCLPELTECLSAVAQNTSTDIVVDNFSYNYCREFFLFSYQIGDMTRIEPVVMSACRAFAPYIREIRLWDAQITVEDMNQLFSSRFQNVKGEWCLARWAMSCFQLRRLPALLIQHILPHPSKFKFTDLCHFFLLQNSNCRAVCFLSMLFPVCPLPSKGWNR